MILHREGNLMSMLAALIHDLPVWHSQKRETKHREIPGNRTATVLALSDLGESIASGVHVIYSPVRLYLCVSMQPKPEALHAQKEADRRMAARPV